MKKKNRNKVCIFCLLVFFSCKQVDHNEVNAIKDFDRLKPKLISAIQYVQKNYYNSESTIEMNRLQFILDETGYRKSSIISDENVTAILNSTNIEDLSFEKNSLCLDQFRFDIVLFRIKNPSNFNYYYVYEFCPLNNEKIDKSSFKSIPLDSLWSLQIEKQ